MKSIAMRDAFFNALYKIAKEDRNVIIVSADFGAKSLDKFRKDLNAQFINVGIAEENMVTIAAGLSLCGKKVFIYAIAPFSTSRCYEMIKVDLSLMNIPVTIVGVGAGFSYDDSGPTHHATEDIAIMRTLPNLTILNSSDSVMAGKFAAISYKIPGPSYVRLDREISLPVYKKNDNFSSGLNILKTGRDICIISTGNMVHKALEVSDNLKDFSIDAGVMDLYRLKPVNINIFFESIKDSAKIITLEEHLVSGGIGSIVVELMADNNKMYPLKRIGIKDKYYYAYGGRKNIQRLCGLDTGTITKTILNWSKNMEHIVAEAVK